MLVARTEQAIWNSKAGISLGLILTASLVRITFGVVRFKSRFLLDLIDFGKQVFNG